MYKNFNCSTLAIIVSSVLMVSACGESTSSSAGDNFNNNNNNTTTPPSSSGFDQKALLTSLADNVITPAYNAFLQQSAAQIQPIEAYCQLEESASENNATSEQVMSAKTTAQTAWRNTMNLWQQAEVMKIGPLADNDSLLRNKIYSWPTVSTCSVDIDVVNFRVGEVNGQPYNIANRTPSRRGLAALEYLLFNEELNHSCTGSTVPENWNNETESARKVARCQFAVEVAKDINNSAQILLEKWNGDDGFANELKNAGTEGNRFATELAAINHISDGLFYIETFTKDGKLATPLGLQANICGLQVCPEAVESLYAHYSINNIENNLLSFQKLFTGQTGLGFTDFLNEVGDTDTADTMIANIQQVIENVQGYENTLAQTLTDNEAQVNQTYTDIKQVTDKLKTDFITSLSLELPATSAGDND